MHDTLSFYDISTCFPSVCTSPAKVQFCFPTRGGRLTSLEWHSFSKALEIMSIREIKTLLNTCQLPSCFHSKARGALRRRSHISSLAHCNARFISCRYIPDVNLPPCAGLQWRLRTSSTNRGKQVDISSVK